MLDDLKRNSRGQCASFAKVNKYVVCVPAQPELVNFDFEYITLFRFVIELNIMY